jgi:ketosteroid isomerase-like protein
MSTEENIQTVKDFFAALGSGDKQRLLSLVAKDIEWIFRARTGRWPVRTAGTRDWRKCFRRLPTRWK